MIKIYSSLLFISSLLYGITTFSQDSIIIPGNKLPTMRFETSTELNYGSTNLNNEFIQKLLFGGKIETGIKDKAIDKIKNKGRFGVEVNYNIKYVNLKDTLFENLPNYNYYIGFGSYNNISASYTKDLFSTVFYGNKQFENQTAILGRSSFISTKFKKITIGLVSKDSKTSYGVSLIIGDRINSYNFRKADMFTHPDGTNITMDYDGTVKLSDGNNMGSFINFSGVGLGLDYSKELLNHKIEITNFGFTIWSKNTKYSNTAKQYDFDGVEIDNLLKVTSEELEFNAKAILPQLEKKSFISLLPSIINLSNVIDQKKEFQPTYGIRYKLLSNYFPYFNAGLVYKVNQHFWLKGTAAYGGYSGVRAELGAYFDYNYFSAGIESQNVTGIFMKDGNGNGLRLYLNKTF